MARSETPHRPTTSIVAARFDRKLGYTNWRPRGGGDWLLIYTESGAGRILAGECAFDLLPGQAILYSPAASQDYATSPSTGRWCLVWAHFVPHPHWVEWLRWQEIDPGTFRLDLVGSALKPKFQAALTRAAAPGTSADFARLALEEALLWAKEAQPAGRGNFDPRVRQAMDYLAAHVASPFRLAAVARACGLSASRLGHLFAEQTGRPLQRYAEELKLDLAKRLLSHTSLAIKEVAQEAGFADPFYFAKRFRAATGFTPTRFRQG